MNNITTAITERSLAGLKITAVQERQRYHNFLIYGEPGVGKTVLAGSADAVPSMRPVLFIDIEGGTNSLVKMYPEVDTVRVTTWKEMQDLYNVLADGNSGYKTIVLDSLTEIQKFNMYWVMEEAVRKRDNVDPDVPAMRDWGVSLEQIRRMVRGFRDLPMNTVFTALDRLEKDPKRGVILHAPSLPGKLSAEIAGFLDEVFYYYVRDIKDEASEEVVATRILLTSKTDSTVAKDRSGELPQVIIWPTMANVVELMSGKAGDKPSEEAEATENQTQQEEKAS